MREAQKRMFEEHITRPFAAMFYFNFTSILVERNGALVLFATNI